ncbi:hypothetical protein [Mesorhizobium huakuii]|uniref:Uncharacterized protein n=1 Tax=Mesorhizobium huakuii TaxID=28104 RepID=A0A7G6SZN3_9HYPH|nr:hypothetical protein [Mesorhizobium huakuii]QND59965.1 hypothetical protein HB778_28010 [Mesorhizobium huakuii]
MAVSPLLSAETPRFGGGSSAQAAQFLVRLLSARQAIGFGKFVGSLPVSGAPV